METTLIPSHSYAQDLLAQAENQLSGVSQPEDWLIEALGGSRSASGVRVGVDTVLGLPAAWRSVDLISSKLACMPAEIQRKAGESWETMGSHPIDKLLNRYCSVLYTTMTLRQTMTLHALLEGNGRAFIGRDAMGAANSLTIMQPKQTDTVVINGEKFHRVFFSRDQYGDVLTPEIEEQLAPWGPGQQVPGSGAYYTIPDSEVLHIPGMSYNGLWGIPLIAIARDVFGVDRSGLDAISYQFRNGGRPGMMLTAPKGMFRTAKEAEEFMAAFLAKHQGTENAGRTGLLREGMDVKVINDAAKFDGLSDLKSTTKSDLALLFGTEYLLGEVSAVYKDLQSRMTAFYQNTLDAWAERWEQEAGRKLLNQQRYMAGTLRVHLDPTKILRGTPNELADYTGKLRTQGLISGNEGRLYHNHNPVPELEDDYGNPNTSSPMAEPEPEPTPEPEPETEEQQPQNSAAGERAIRRHFRNMIGHECRRVMQAADTESGFFDRIDDFYQEFEKGLMELCEDLLIDPEAAKRHCAQSRESILDVAGAVVGDQLQDAIKTLVSDWEERHAKFTDLQT